MKDRISPATLIASVALFFSLATPAAATSGAPPHKMRTVSFTSTSTERHITVPGRGIDMFVATVRINHQEAAYAEGTPAVTTVYGNGVVIRFTQSGNRHFISTVALQATSVVIRYRLSG